MNIQENLDMKLDKFPESWLKRLQAQPLNGSSVINISSGTSTQTRIEIPSCVQRPDLIEVGYQLSLNNGNPFAVTGAAGANKVPVFMTPATYLPEWSRIEIYHADSTNKLFECTNLHKFSKMTSSLFNNYNKRCTNQRFNFKKDRTSQVIAQNSTGATTYYLGNGGNYILPNRQSAPNGMSSVNDGYLNDFPSLSNTSIEVTATEDNQQEYLPLGYLYPSTPVTNSVGVINFQPYTYNFNFKLRDLLHDSWLSLEKHYFHSANLVILVYWNPISEIVAQLPVTASTTDGLNFATGPIKNGALQAFNGTVTLNNGAGPTQAYNLTISNMFCRYYSEQNPDVVNLIKSMDYDIAYPYIYQNNNSIAGSQIGSNLVIGQEGENRIYRVYTALFGNNSNLYNRFLSDNTSNIGYDIPNTNYGKWNGRFELYLNNDLIENLTASYGDWYEGMKCFMDGSITSKSELEYLGTIAYHFDSNRKNGLRDEYAHNVLKGRYTTDQVNLNPRFINVQTDSNDNPNSSYTHFTFAVIMRRAVIRKGQMEMF